METAFTKVVFFAALTLTALLCGASLDQSIKQLPARKVIGAQAFSAYARAADLRNGVIWYAILGLGSALSCVVLAILCLLAVKVERYYLPLYIAGIFAILHSICTVMAAPVYHHQKYVTETDALEKLLNRFERIQTFRTAFIVLNLSSLLWCLWTIS